MVSSLISNTLTSDLLEDDSDLIARGSNRSEDNAAVAIGMYHTIDQVSHASLLNKLKLYQMLGDWFDIMFFP